MQLTFIRYAVLDNGIALSFSTNDPINPGDGIPATYHILITDIELLAVTTQIQLRQLVLDKMNRKHKAFTIAAKLDPFIGQSVTI